MVVSSIYKYLIIFFITVIISITVTAQDSSVIKNNFDTLIGLQGKLVSLTSDAYPLQYPFNKKRVRGVALANVVGYGAILYGLSAAWYSGFAKSKFHSFDDNSEWLQIDKIGHSLSAYAESKASYEVWRWTGISRKKRILLGGLSGAAYQTIIETLDGFSSDWGWSWGDFGANIVGSGIFTAQELAWNEQRIQFKFSFHKKNYADNSLNKRSTEIFGSSEPERFLKDYNGQTYWLSANIKSFFPKSRVPSWLSIAVGTGAEGMFGARDNIGKDKLGNITFARNDIQRYRQWYFAPDIDLTKIKTKKRGVKMALNILNIFKFPMPSLEYSKAGFRVNFIHF
ncbi:MAG: DUF2279 domain-containing protein [Ferruginibacter sp.]|nr:DUF2279 domain-containing protein [Ferruginibacter sp.]